MKFPNYKTLNDWTSRLPCRDFDQLVLDLFPLLERESLSANCSPLHDREDIWFGAGATNTTLKTTATNIQFAHSN